MRRYSNGRESRLRACPVGVRIALGAPSPVFGRWRKGLRARLRPVYFCGFESHPADHFGPLANGKAAPLKTERLSRFESGAAHHPSLAQLVGGGGFKSRTVSVRVRGLGPL
jgi:hypothetical protein